MILSLFLCNKSNEFKIPIFVTNETLCYIFFKNMEKISFHNVWNMNQPCHVTKITKCCNMKSKFKVAI
jgi:hypothetical protein